ncbi:hypothetical protein PLICRDRAFT_379640 [Plicaturopsis crispa FD-325 SS-3]|nr:hypothetical protein PLICRDRAFT_379640 [Plicaturopsis crispa FD-325 SS-3]
MGVRSPKTSPLISHRSIGRYKHFTYRGLSAPQEQRSLFHRRYIMEQLVTQLIALVLCMLQRIPPRLANNDLISKPLVMLLEIMGMSKWASMKPRPCP